MSGRTTLSSTGTVTNDVCVIGGGIVGLATAAKVLARRPGADVVLLEKETDLARHQTGRNSGVFGETARMLHVYNAPSPAATSALPIGEMIAARAWP